MFQNILIITAFLYFISANLLSQDKVQYFQVKIIGNINTKIFINDNYIGNDSVSTSLLNNKYKVDIIENDIKKWNKFKITKYFYILSDTTLYLNEMEHNCIRKTVIEKINLQIPKDANGKLLLGIDKKIWLIGSSIIFGGFSMYYKIKANDNYFNFSKSKSNLEIVNKYDIISGIFLGILQINLGYLAYLLITE